MCSSDLASRSSEVNREVEGIVGLNAAQFRQVILLPQGRFAEVLRAKADEREALLKTLFETVIHERAGGWLEDQARSALRAIEEQRRQLAWLRQQAAQEWLPFAQREPAGSAAATGADPSADPMAAADVQAGTPEPGVPADQAGLDRLLERIRQVVVASEESRRRATETLEAAQRHRAAVVQAADRFDRRAAAWSQLAELEPQRPLIEALAQQLAAADRAEGLRPSLEADQVARRELQELELRLRRELERAAAARDGARGLPDAVVALGLLSLPESADLQRSRTALATRRVEVEGLARQAEEASQTRERAARALALQQRAQGERVQAQGQLQRLKEERLAAEAALQAARSAADRLDGLTQAKDSLAGQALASRQVRKGRRLEAEAIESLRAAEQRLAVATTALRTLRERQLAGMAARLAGELSTGTPCPVCGSSHHPQPARRSPDAVNEGQIEAAEATLTQTRQEQQAAAVHLADIRVRLESVLEKAGAAAEDPAAAVAAAEQAELALTAARQQAEQLPQLERNLAEQALQITALESSLQAATTTAAVQERSAATDTQRAAALEAAVAAELGEGVVPRQVLDSLAAMEQALDTLARSCEAGARLRSRQEQAAARLERDLAAAGIADAPALEAALRSEPERIAWRQRIEAFHQALTSQRAILAGPDLQDLPDQRPDTAAAEVAEAAADGARTTALERHSEARGAEDDIHRLGEEHRRLAGALAEQQARAEQIAAVADRCQGKLPPYISLQRWVLSA